MRIEKTILPKDAPKYLIVIPTRNRWENHKGTEGCVVAMIISLQEALERDGLCNDTWIIIADSSDISQQTARDKYLKKTYEKLHRFARTFILTTDIMKTLAEMVCKKIIIRSEIIEAILTASNYASQRQKLDVITGALVLQNGPKYQLTIDDDIIFPKTYGILRQEFLQKHGFDQKPNSQILMTFKNSINYSVNSGVETPTCNFIRPLFDYVGLTVSNIRITHKNLRVTSGLSDTLQEDALDEITRRKEMTQAVYTHTQESDIKNSDKARVLGVSGLTTLMPDFATSKIAEAQLLNEFPTEEISVLAYPSGANTLFGYGRGGINIVSSGLTRFIDKKTMLYPWWFVSSESISLNNPLKIVRGPYRADNDLLPGLFDAIEHLTGERNIYLAGINSVMLHNRAPYGAARTDIIEQAMQSLVGKIPAHAILERLYFDQSENRFRVNKIDNIERYKAPRNQVAKIFEKMQYFALICDDKIRELSRHTISVEQKIIIERYRLEKSKLVFKSGKFNFAIFHKNLSIETRDQINFYANVLDALPAIITEVNKLIEDKKFSVLEIFDKNKI